MLLFLNFKTKVDKSQVDSDDLTKNDVMTTSINVPRAIVTHAQRVCRLYKRACRVTEDHEGFDRSAN